MSVVLSSVCIYGRNQMRPNTTVNVRDRLDCIRFLLVYIYGRNQMKPNTTVNVMDRLDCIRFLLGHKDDPREIENDAYSNCFLGGRVKEVFYGICKSREFHMHPHGSHTL